LLWAYTEHKLISKEDQNNGVSLNIRIFDNAIDGLRPPIIIPPELGTSYTYFKNRYVSRNAVADLRNLHLSNSNRRFVREALENGRNAQVKFKAVAYICTRLRNNLFHGRKELPHIVAQGELFAAASTGLKGLLTALKRS